MKLKQYLRFEVNFKSRWIETSAALMGISFFLRLFYYFAVTNLRDIAGVELVFSLFCGLALCIGYIVCLVCIRLNAPGLYGIFGAAFCLMLIILGFMSGDVLRIVLGTLWYFLAAIVLLTTVGGYLPGKLLAGIMFAIPFLVRFFFYDYSKLSFVDWLKEVPILCIIAALGCFAMGLKPRTKS